MDEVLDENQINKVKKIRFSWIVFFIYFTLLLIGLIFWNIHWPGGAFFTLLGTASIFAYCASNLLFLNKGRNLNLVFTIVSGIWFLSILLGSVFFSYPFIMKGVWIMIATFTLVLIPHLLHRIYQRSKRQ